MNAQDHAQDHAHATTTTTTSDSPHPPETQGKMSVLTKEFSFVGDHRMKEGLRYKDGTRVERTITYHGSLDYYTAQSRIWSDHMDVKLELAVTPFTPPGKTPNSLSLRDMDVQVESASPLTAVETEYVINELRWLSAARQLTVAASSFEPHMPGPEKVA